MGPQLLKEQLTVGQQGQVCVLCKRSTDDEALYGKLYTCGSVTAHYYCLLFSSGLGQRGKDGEGILGFLEKDIEKEVQRGRKLTCTACKQTGATVGCCNRKCMKTYHYPCGVEQRMVNQYFGAFSSFCFRHRPSQTVKADILDKETMAMCTICQEQLVARPDYGVLWAPCCGKQSWFHRSCMQKLALSAGYFFKCPICSNSAQFCSEMKRCGIYVPEQDASWELEPNAFEDLVRRHNECDAANCICPKGRRHDSDGTRWELLLYSACGSKGVHIGCGRLHWSTMEWECDDCNLSLKQVETRDESTKKAGHGVVSTSTPALTPAAQSVNGVGIGGAVKRPHPSEDSVSSSDTDSDVDVLLVSDAESAPPPPPPPPAPASAPRSRNVARRGRVFFPASRSRPAASMNFERC